MRHARIPALLVVLGACSQPMISDGSSDAIVTGQVSSPSGPLMGARLTLTARDSSTGQPHDQAIILTDSLGRYQRRLAAFLVAPFRGAVSIEVASPPAAGLRDTVVVVHVSFRQPPGVANAGIVLEPRAPGAHRRFTLFP
jgi:hypothetical protein